MEKKVFDRLVEEFQSLNEKIAKLRTFILDTEQFEKLDQLNRDLLIGQLKSMESYISFLSIRIGLNSPSENNVEEVSE